MSHHSISKRNPCPDFFFFFIIIFMGLWTEGCGSLLAVSNTSVLSSDGTQCGRKTVSEAVWTLGRDCRNVSGVAGWEPGWENVTQSDLKRELWETPTGESWILWRRELWVWGCAVRAEPQRQTPRTPNQLIDAEQDHPENTPTVT